MYSCFGSRNNEPVPKNSPTGASTDGSLRLSQKIRSRALANWSAASSGTENAIRRIIVGLPLALQTSAGSPGFSVSVPFSSRTAPPVRRDVCPRSADQIEHRRRHRAARPPTFQRTRKPIDPRQHLPKNEVSGAVVSSSIRNAQALLERDRSPRKVRALRRRPGVVEPLRKQRRRLENRVLRRMQRVARARFLERCIPCHRPNIATGCRANGCNARTTECRDQVHPARHCACRRSGE